MASIDNQHIERLKTRLTRSIGKIDIFFEKLVAEERYSFSASKLNDFARNLIQMSMISYRLNDQHEYIDQYLPKAKILISKFQELESLIRKKSSAEIGQDPYCFSTESFEATSFILLLNHDVDTLNNVLPIVQSEIINREFDYPFPQQYTPLVVLGALDKKEEFESAYQAFKELKKSYFEEGLSLYIEILAAIVSRDQTLFDDLHLQAEAAMQSHATDKKWGDDIMTGGHEYNAIAYDYRGTALCCLAKIRGMEVNHFSCFYPKEIIEA